MDLFHFKKSIKIFMCSVLTFVVIATSALSFSFKSSAMILAPGIDSQLFLSSFYSFLLSNKILADNIVNPFNSVRSTTEQLQDSLALFDKANEYQAGLGDDLFSALYSGALKGAITVSEDDMQNFVDFLEYCETNNIAIPLFNTSDSYPLAPASYTSTIIVQWHKRSNPTIYTDTITITASSPYFIGMQAPSSIYQEYVFKCLQTDKTALFVSKTSTNSSESPCSIHSGWTSYTNSDGNTFSGPSSGVTLLGSQPYEVIYDSIATYFYSFPGLNKLFSTTDIADIFTSMIQTGTATLDTTTSGTRVNDSTEVISSTSTVSETGEITGPFSINIVDLDSIIEAIYGIKDGVISLHDALGLLRLGTVSESDTVQEKQAAISELVEIYPASSITDSQAGTITVPAGATTTVQDSVSEMSAVQHVAHAIANTIADIRGVPRPYPDEEPDAGPAGDPYLDGWEFPSLDPDNPDPGGTDPDSTEDANRAADVVNGLAFVSGFIGSFYNASKGYNMVFTVGISFVIFSVIIGASHFFGALMGTHDINGPTTIKELEASRERQIKVQQRAYQKSLKHNRSTG